MILYRGEAVKHGHSDRIQTLRSCIRSGFPTEFIHGGNPYLLARLGFFDAAISHIASNFNLQGKRHLKHFISFSEDKAIAQKYAYGITAPQDYIQEISVSSYYRDITSELTSGSFNFENEWSNIEHIIVSIDSNGSIPIQSGFDYGFIRSYNNGNSKILLLNSFKYFEIQKVRMGNYVTADVERAAENSARDKEWLVLVLDLIPNQPGVPASSSGLIKHGDPLTIEICIDPANESYGSSSQFL
jgi:hypothetical protein